MKSSAHNISSKLPKLPESIFTTMSRLANEHNAINIAQGFPNFEPDPVLIQLVAKAMKDGYNQYAPLGGIYSLKEVIAEKIALLYGTKYHPQSEITITVGATQAIFTAISAMVWPNDEVIVLKPAYDCYEPAIIANGGIPVLIQLTGKDYAIDWDAFKAHLNDKTRMVIINTPHNPSGMVFSSSDMLMLQSCLKDTNIILLSDEVYEHIVFDGNLHESASKYPDLATRSFVCASFGKTFHATGWKMGYCAAPAELMKEFQKIHEFNVFCVNHPFQRALAEYLKQPAHYLDLGPFYQEKRDLFLSAIKNSRFKFNPTQGTYFQLLDFSEISNESDIAFAERLVKEYGIACIPISVFNKDLTDNKQVRICFAKTTETLLKAAEIITTI
ncbi:methionine aminotransferase [uncultured Eudoraea sp.]|uniref:methionine aminotransferase n=1 Tax=uncultured Eudoraea sp. TaxID=1035614 RepID=UPI00261FEB54|nr:methionine aminotransferase [uncultured Eudoraea sp.]